LEGRQSACADEVVPGWTSLGLVRWDSGSIRLSPPRPRFRPGSRALVPSILRRRCRWVAALYLSIRRPRGKLAASGGRFAERLNTAPFLAGKAKLQGLHPPTSLVCSHPRVRRWNLPFLPWACFPFEALSSRGSSAAALGSSLPRFGHLSGPSVRASGPEDLLRNPRAAGVAPLRSLSGERATAASVRPKPAGRLRWPPWGF
jgi:hypothetical protein